MGSLSTSRARYPLVRPLTTLKFKITAGNALGILKYLAIHRSTYGWGAITAAAMGSVFRLRKPLATASELILAPASVV